jgi:hypothetical protein
MGANAAGASRDKPRRRTIRRGHDAVGKDHRLRQGQRGVGLGLRHDQRLVQEAQSLYRQGRAEDRRAADDDLHPDRRHRVPVPGRGAYRRAADELDNTYEAITNYLDEKRLEAKDLFIEQYETDPVTADGKKLTVDVLVLLK